MLDTVAASYTFVGDHVSAPSRRGEGEGGEGGGRRRRSETWDEASDRVVEIGIIDI